MLRLVCLVAKELTVASRKAEVYKAIVRMMMTRLKERGGVAFDQNVVTMALKRLAWKSFKRRQLIVAEEEIGMIVDDIVRRKRADGSEIRAGSDNVAGVIACGLLKDDGKVSGASCKGYSWVHYTFQEFLAADFACNDFVFTNSKDSLEDQLNRLGVQLKGIWESNGDDANVFFSFVCGLGGRAFQCLEQWYPQILNVPVGVWPSRITRERNGPFGRFDEELIIRKWTSGPLGWLDEGGEMLVKFVCVFWKKLIGECGGKMLEASGKRGYLQAVELISEMPTCYGGTFSLARCFELACENGHTAVVELCMLKGVTLTSNRHGGSPRWNQRGVNNVTLFGLKRAIRGEHVAVVKLLSEKGVDINGAVRRDGKTALHYACYCGHVLVVRWLVERRADVEAVTKNGETALHFSFHCRGASVAKLLIENGAKIDAITIDGQTALHYACLGDESLVELLIRRGANVEASTHCGETALHYACEYGHIAAVKLLIEKNLKMIEARTNDGKTALHCASSAGHDLVVELLIEVGANVEARTNDGNTALHCASSAGHDLVVKLLIRAGADIEALRNDGETALRCSVGMWNYAVLKMLIENQARVNASDFLLYVDTIESRYGYGEPPLAELLIRNVPNAERVKYSVGETVLHWAIRRGHAVIVKLLIEIGVDVDAVLTESGETALHYACRYGQPAVVKLLIEKGANMAAVTLSGETALHLARIKGAVWAQLLLKWEFRARQKSVGTPDGT
jgi:ankyrin repeat protein